MLSGRLRRGASLSTHAPPRDHARGVHGFNVARAAIRVLPLGESFDAKGFVPSQAVPVVHVKRNGYKAGPRPSSVRNPESHPSAGGQLLIPGT